MRGETDRFRTMLGAIMRYKDPGDCPSPLSRLWWEMVMKMAMMAKSLVARVTRMEGPVLDIWGSTEDY